MKCAHSGMCDSRLVIKLFAIITLSLATVFTFTDLGHCEGQGVTADFYEAQIKSGSADSILLTKNYVRGALDGIQFANVLLISKKQTPLFCPPDNLGLNTANAMQMIDYLIEPLTTAEKRKADISVLLLMALENAFPCAK